MSEKSQQTKLHPNHFATECFQCQCFAVPHVWWDSLWRQEEIFAG